MQLYHFIDPKTNIVAYADKPETGKIDKVAEVNASFLVISSQTGDPNAPKVFPGYLYHEGTFWAPLRGANQVTGGNIAILKDDFMRLFTFDELTDIFNCEDDVGISKKHKRQIKAFLRYLDSQARISLSHPTVLDGLDFFVNVGYLTADRKQEVLTSIFKQ
jgi:hypothetical protein